MAKCGRKPIPEAKVLRIRALHDAGHGYGVIARICKVHKSTARKYSTVEKTKQYSAKEKRLNGRKRERKKASKNP